MTATTATKNTAHGPMTARKRRCDKPSSVGGDNVGATAIGPLEDGDGDFKDFIKAFGSQDGFRIAICGEPAPAERHHAARVA